MIKLKQGFTLLEMVVVITIVSILFLLTIPNIQKVLSVVEEKGCNAQVKVVDAAVLQYRLEHDENPGSVADLISAGYLSEEQAVCSGGRRIAVTNGQASAQ